jgi:hypothetical protein
MVVQLLLVELLEFICFIAQAVIGLVIHLSCLMLCIVLTLLVYEDSDKDVYR